ncbi:hypothetical protein BD410DRAFT_783093 [Rickenella mellea]|uniref:Uncharacterized protein n=1 Tax=Rickenella mellea TaxID=50990 RepID=A0A4Y7QH46_9AGAM|nr:hypothetical protein BD410DRAFT_783093 [Rickenella mellea]
MPGPCSAKRKKKQEAMKAKLKAVRVGGHQEVEKLDNVDVSLQNRAELTDVQKPPRHNYNGDTDASAVEKLDAVPPDASNLKPFIEDPGNGPRVKDTRAFLRSFFALPPSLDDPTCAYFARDGVLAALLELLPEEIAHVCIFPLQTRMTK